MASLTEYMRKELIFYIKQEYDRGIPLSRIKKSLREGGHHQNLIKEAMSVLKKNNYNLIKSLNEPIKSNLDKELYFNIMNSLIKYAEHQLAAGKSEKEVKKILSDYGHSNEIIEKAIKGVSKEIPSTGKIVRRMDIGMIIGIILLILITAGGTNEPLHIIIGAFIPTLLTVSVLNFQRFSSSTKNFQWIYAPTFSMAVIVLGEMGFLREGYQYFSIAMLNLGISLLYTLIKSARTSEIEDYVENLKSKVSTNSDKEIKDKQKKTKKTKK